MTQKEQNAEVQNELERVESKYHRKTVIADFYQLARLDGKNFSTEAKKLIRKGVKVEVSHLAVTNHQWSNCGKLYIVDDEATKAWHKELAEHRENIVAQDKLKQKSAQALAEAIDNASKMTASKPGSKPAGGKNKKGNEPSAEAIDLAIEDHVNKNPTEFESIEAAKDMYAQGGTFKKHIDSIAAAL